MFENLKDRFEVLMRRGAESQESPLKLRHAHDFASSLSIHVNYLNRSVKEVTGKPTSAHISDRITTEARALLKHTNWSIAEIAYSLGFEYPIYLLPYIVILISEPNEKIATFNWLPAFCRKSSSEHCLYSITIV